MDDEDEIEDDEDEIEDDEDEIEDEDDDDMSKYQVDPERVPLFEKTEEQMESFFEEFSILSKKKPDGPLNKFKVKILNHTLRNANEFLADHYRPFPDFDEFDSEDLPTASDVVTMLAQYLRSMNIYRRDHSYTDNYRRRWNTTDGREMTAKAPKKFDK